MPMRTATLVIGLTAWSTLAFGDGVRFADLQGKVIDVAFVQQMRILRDGKERSPERRMTGQIKIGPGDTITTTFTNSSIRNGRTRVENPSSGMFKLDEQRKAGFDDDVVWTFADNNLVRLRVFGTDSAGAQKMVIAFQRSPDGLQCKFSMEFLREDGTGPIRPRSRRHNIPVDVLEVKPISSSCRVTKSDVARDK